ncbi:hypothetical protein BDY17DRAFT_301374 [Neohortaea acidophila]|uniref:TPR-like protein n=1 Tax=Neohortaea acidophila TaxID=245834 RepID=A0A6A6PQD9_9PEZI|nr:uncharacterized protein BDY17DRAFT_301374 [Neohortaea acidophila]KAF2481457.1 hypothetical protein BDY17DRAFT_301374 [Neohortaea acidophila]
MSTKTALKAAKAALDAGDQDKAIAEAQKVLSSDPQNYFARLFLARAYELQGNPDEAASTYDAAAKSKPDDSQAWLGLCSVYESQNSQRVDEYREAVIKVALLFAKADDLHRSQTAIDKFISFAKKHGSKAQYKRALKCLLPGTPIYEYLEGRLPHPSQTYIRLADMTETEEAQRIKQEIANRRTRIGAKLGQVTTDVKREVYSESNLSRIYQDIIDWTTADDVRRQYEEKLLERAYDILVNCPPEAKANQLDTVLTLAEGMVIIHHEFKLAWDLVLESRDLGDLQQLDSNVLYEYTALFPSSGLGKVLEGWLTSEISPFPIQEQSKDGDEIAKPLAPEDRLLVMTEGLAETEASPLAHRLVAHYLLHLEEHESAADTSRKGLQAVATESLKMGLSMQNTKDALNSVLATSLVYHQAPRHHVEARRLFEDILQRKPKWTPALIGLGLILEENEEYDRAIDFLSQAHREEPSNVQVGTELAWCRAQNGSYAEAQQELEAYLPDLSANNPRSRELRAQVLYRIGVCIWQLDSSKTARKSRTGAYASFLSAIKTNANFAPAYTSLGIYYTDYSKDRKRGRQCFQKAFELSPNETVAAERLAQSFADQGDWEIVEVIAQRVVDTGRAKPPPGSKRKGLSWPYSALGVVQMNRQEYQLAITSFLAALRINPDDYQSYVGLGESYHNSGRYNSALRTFNHALNLRGQDGVSLAGETWFAEYMLANVYRELGEYDEAITGLRNVLKPRPHEFGVLTSLLQTLVEKAWRCLETGLFGQAIAESRNAIHIAVDIVSEHPSSFNMWKAVGDACVVFSWVQSDDAKFPTDELRQLLHISLDDSSFRALAEVDSVTLKTFATDGDEKQTSNLSAAIVAGILAFKRAIDCCTHDPHAQAVAWYNLGWAEQRAYSYSTASSGRQYLKAAVRCFKRAIELEAGNSEFWNALGVVTSSLNPKVAQHSLIRSLHLNEMNARVWTNLGVLYLSQNDHELAHQAFGRAQSTDPTYAHAWLGEGLIALLLGDSHEALSHFTHALEIAESSSLITKRQYAVSIFDHLLATPTASNDLTTLIQPIFALEQLSRQAPADLPYKHLSALFLERVGNHEAATAALTSLCIEAEAEYEVNESLPSLARFAHAKCDLARNLLATGDFEAAADNAETALDLSADAENSGLEASARTKLRLSAHLTAGSAFHYLQKHKDAIGMFRSAIQESNADPDVVCSLVQILWAHGGEDEKTVAREQLFECVESWPEHVRSVTLLGAISALEDDAESMAAVEDDLVTLRTKHGLTMSERGEIENLLAACAALSVDSPADGDVRALAEAQAAIALHPDGTHAWSKLAELSGDVYASRMALKTAQKTVPPWGDVQAEGLATAFAGVGTISDAQRSLVLAPWLRDGRDALHEALSGSI